MRAVIGSIALLGLAGCGQPAAEPESEAPVAAVTPDLDSVRGTHDVAFSPTQWDRITRMASVPSLPANPTNRVADDLSAAEFGHHQARRVLAVHPVRLFKLSSIFDTTQLSFWRTHRP